MFVLGKIMTTLLDRKKERLAKVQAALDKLLETGSQETWFNDGQAEMKNKKLDFDALSKLETQLEKEIEMLENTGGFCGF